MQPEGPIHDPNCPKLATVHVAKVLGSLPSVLTITPAPRAGGRRVGQWGGYDYYFRRARVAGGAGPSGALPINSGLFQKNVGAVKAVDHVSFSIPRGQTLGLVGESGCGKTSMARSIVQLVKPTGGQIFFDGEDLTKLKGGSMRAMYRRVQFIFQDPYGSLDPRMTAGDIVGEPLQVHKLTKGKDAYRARIAELLTLVGLNPYMAGQVSARIQRRAAAAYRHRAGAGGRTGAANLRRAGVGAGRVGAGADHQPAGGPAAAVRADVPVHRARPIAGAAHQPPGGRDVPGQARRSGGERGAVRQSAAPVHAGADVRHSSARPRRGGDPCARGAAGGAAESRQPSRGVRVSPAMPDRHRRMLGRASRSCARCCRGTTWPAFGCSRAHPFGRPPFESLRTGPSRAAGGQPQGLRLQASR